MYGSIIQLIGRSDLAAVTLAGAGSGIAYSLTVCPFEFAKVNVQRAVGQKGVTLLSVVMSQKNPLGLYRGFRATVARDCMEGAGYFFTIECTTRSDALNATCGATAPFVAGGITGMVHCTMGFPFDCVKTSFQSKQNIGYRAVIEQLYADGGIKRFFSGYTPAVVRALFAHSCGTAVMNCAQSFM
eukprot:GEMP01098229.1.p1 GENE.GEMP01098229.1~~GEMP01098229.1.p1  ORF type:complete len:185 (+),score=29.14 GEMP01098229.1:252-806(+)